MASQGQGAQHRASGSVLFAGGGGEGFAFDSSALTSLWRERDVSLMQRAWA